MKKIFFILSMLCFAWGNTNAQSLYKTVRDKANKVVNDLTANQDNRDVNQFKIMTLNYIVAQVSKRGINKDGLFYDSQAVSMTSFVDDCFFYAMKAGKISAAKKKQVLDCYKNASLAFPMFNDPDKKSTQMYVRKENTFTPFSLDTDWDKAYDKACKDIKSIIK